jgi:RHS repeat-associated protein
MRKDGELTYLHTDHLGSASLSTDATGGVTSEMRYYPYGQTRSGTMDTDRLYTGQRWEAGIGLYDYNARYYDPALGRFVQADTVVPSPHNSQSFNRYLYTLGNPLRYADPNGHLPKDLIDEIITQYNQRHTEAEIMAMLEAMHFGDRLYVIYPDNLTQVYDLGEATIGEDGTLQFYHSKTDSWHGIEDINRWYAEGAQYSLYFSDSQDRFYLRYSTAPDNPSIAVRPTWSPSTSYESCKTLEEQFLGVDLPEIVVETYIGAAAGSFAGPVGTVVGGAVGMLTGALTVFIKPRGAMEGDWTLQYVYETESGQLMYEVTVVRNRQVVSAIKDSYYNESIPQ